MSLEYKYASIISKLPFKDQTWEYFNAEKMCPVSVKYWSINIFLLWLVVWSQF